MTNAIASSIRFERRTAASDGVILGWRDYGPPGAPALALVHGLGAGAEQFNADALYFAEHGYRVIVPDLRGHGQSEKPSSGDYSIPRMAQDLVEIFADAGTGPIHYVGNSLGGILALHLIGQQSSLFRSLTTFGTATTLNLPGWTATFIPWSYRIIGRKLLSRLSARGTTRTQQGRQVVEALLKAFDPDVGKAIGSIVAKYDLTAHALNMDKPYLIIRGADDKAVNRTLDPKLSQLGANPNITVSRMKGAGHCANLDQPEQFRNIVQNFIAGR